MSKQSWKGSTLLNPEPPVLVSCGGLDKPNLITIGWTGTICTQPSMVSISVRPERFSHHLIKESGQFAINLPTEALVRSVDWCGVKSGRDVDKFAACGLHSAPGSVLTDCPHREKLGWLEEAHLMQYSVQYRYNLARLYEKTFNDMRSTQAANGMIPTIAPELVEFEGGFKDTPEWGSTFVISPWYIYQWYGDTRPIETYYPDMQRYIDYLSSKADNHILSLIHI